MKLIKDLGKRYPTKSSRHKKAYALFLCERCGREYENSIDNVKRNKGEFCGKCNNAIAATTHGKNSHRLNNIWQGMKQRCYNEKHPKFYRYGERCIVVCDEWRDDFSTFYEWAVGNGYSDNLTIDRINNDGNYEPNNCRWATATTQANNRSNNKRNSTGYTGIDINNGKYRARLTYNGEDIYIGLYNTKKEAVLGYNQFVKDKGLLNKVLEFKEDLL